MFGNLVSIPMNYFDDKAKDIHLCMSHIRLWKFQNAEVYLSLAQRKENKFVLVYEEMNIEPEDKEKLTDLVEQFQLKLPGNVVSFLDKRMYLVFPEDEDQIRLRIAMFVQDITFPEFMKEYYENVIYSNE